MNSSQKNVNSHCCSKPDFQTQIKTIIIKKNSQVVSLAKEWKVNPKTPAWIFWTKNMANLKYSRLLGICEVLHTHFVKIQSG